MATAGAIKAGEAYVRLFADDSALRQALDQSSKRLRAFGTAVAAAGAGLTAIGIGALGGLVAAATTFSEAGDAIDKASMRTGHSTEFVSEMGFAAEQSGSSVEGLEKAAQKLQQTLGAATKGGAAATASIEAIGLSVEDLMRQSPDEQFLTVAEALGSIQSEAVRAEAAMALLGSEGAKLIPLFLHGREGMYALRRRASELGLTFDQEAAKSAAKLNDALGSLRRSIWSLWVWIGSAVAPEVTWIANELTHIVAATSKWIRANKAAVLVVGQVAVASVAIGGALIAIGGAFVLAGVAAASFSAIIGVIGMTVGFLISPLGRLTALLAGGIGVLVEQIRESRLFGEVLKLLGGKFLELRGTAIATLDGIRDAFAGGDLALAVNVLWAGVQLAWAQGVQALAEVWALLELSMAATNAQILLHWEGLCASLDSRLYKTVRSALDAFTNIAAGAKTTFESVTGWVADGVLDVHGAISPDFDVGAAKQIRGINDAATIRRIGEDRDRILKERGEDYDNLGKEQESRQTGEQEAILDALEKKEKALKDAAEERREVLAAQVELLKSQHEYLRREAELRATIAGSNNQAERDALEAAIAETKKLQSTSFGDFGGRAIEAYRPDSREATEKQLLNETKRAADAGEKQVRAITDLAQSLTFA